MLRTSKEAGFTLIELMITVGIIGILAGMALGFSGDFVRRARFNGVTRNVFSSLALGRAEAVRRGEKVSVNFGASKMYTFVDLNNDHLFQVGETLIVSYEMESAMTVASPILTAANGLATAIFDYRGFSQDIAGKPLALMVCVSDSRLRDVNGVEVTIAGAARIRTVDGFEVCPTSW